MKYLEFKVKYDTRKQIPVRDKLTSELHMKDNPKYGDLLSKELTSRGHVSISKLDAHTNNSIKLSTGLLYELAPNKDQVGQNDYKPVAKKPATKEK